MYFPTLKTSPVYDFSDNQWHERAIWNPNIRDWIPHFGRCHSWAFSKWHLVGDRQSAAIYRQDRDFFYSTLVVSGGTLVA